MGGLRVVFRVITRFASRAAWGPSCLGSERDGSALFGLGFAGEVDFGGRAGEVALAVGLFLGGDGAAMAGFFEGCFFVKATIVWK